MAGHLAATVMVGCRCAVIGLSGSCVGVGDAISCGADRAARVAAVSLGEGRAPSLEAAVGGWVHAEVVGDVAALLDPQVGRRGSVVGRIGVTERPTC